MTFESSPYYMFHPLAAERIARDLPGVKLHRAASATRSSGRTRRTPTSSPAATRPSRSSAALELEPERLAGEAERMIADPTLPQPQPPAPRLRGPRPVHRPARAAGRRCSAADRIHVVDSGDFFPTPEPSYDGVLRFLGLPHLGYPRVRAAQRAPAPAA